MQLEFYTPFSFGTLELSLKSSFAGYEKKLTWTEEKMKKTRI